MGKHKFSWHVSRNTWSDLCGRFYDFTIFLMFGLSYVYTKDLYLVRALNLIFLLLHEIRRISWLRTFKSDNSRKNFTSQRGRGAMSFELWICQISCRSHEIWQISYERPLCQRWQGLCFISLRATFITQRLELNILPFSSFSTQKSMFLLYLSWNNYCTFWPTDFNYLANFLNLKSKFSWSQILEFSQPRPPPLIPQHHHPPPLVS